MKTVKRLIKELQKFPEGAVCHAYEGECSGISIEFKGKHGFIHVKECEPKDEKTELLK